MRFLKVILIVWAVLIIMMLGLEYLGIAGQGIEQKIDVRSLSEAWPSTGTHFWEHNGLGACTHFDYLLENTGVYIDSLADTALVYGTVVRDRH